MSLATYSDLISAVQAEVEGNASEVFELTSDIVMDKIALVEARLNRKLRLREMEQQDTTTYDSTNTTRRISVPSDYLELLTFEFKPVAASDSEYRELSYVSPQRLATYYRRRLGWYTTRVDFELNAPADQVYTLKLHYLQRWNLASQSSNWLLLNFPDAYYYGTLIKCRMYFKDSGLFEQYQAYYDEALTDLNELDSRGRDDSTLEADSVPAGTQGYYDGINDRF